MDIPICLFTATAKKPTRGSAQAAGLDLCADEKVHVLPGRTHRIRTGVGMEIPPGFEGRVRARSGHALKSIFVQGEIDSDYRGDINVVLTNLGFTSFDVEIGDRIAQIIITPIATPDLVVVDKLTPTARDAGGFGHTGTR